MGIQLGVRYYLKEMKGMTKILTRKIENCEDCFYLDEHWCNHSNGNRGFVDDYENIPDWCPLPDWIPGPVWGDADWGMEEKEDE
jgi:hypothetical protein